MTKVFKKEKRKLQPKERAASLNCFLLSLARYGVLEVTVCTCVVRAGCLKYTKVASPPHRVHDGSSHMNHNLGTGTSFFFIPLGFASLILNYINFKKSRK